MKKILAVVLAVLMLAQTSVFASELPFIDKDYFTYEETVTYSAKLNQPFKLKLNEDGISDSVGSFVDVEGLFTSLFDSTSTLVGKADISPDYKSGKIYGGGVSIVPVKVNKNLKITADANTEAWIEYDFSDISKPVFKMIQNNPMFDKYVVYDVDALLSSVGGAEKDVFYAVMSKILSKDVIEQCKTAYADLLVKYGDIKKDGKGYTITIDDFGFKSILEECVANISNFAEDFVVSGNYATKEEFDEAYNEVIPYVFEVLDALKTVKIIGDKGIVMKVECDNKGYIKNSDISANICVNVLEIAQNMGADISAYNVEDGILDLTLNMNTEVKKLSNVKVDMPVINEENSIDFGNFYAPNPDFEPDVDWHQHWSGGYVEHNGLPIVVNGEFYPHLRDMALAVGFADCDITYENGVVTLMRPDWVECGKYKTASFAAGSNLVYIDGEVYTVDNPALEVNDEIVISDEIAKLLFRVADDYKSYIGVDFLEKGYGYSFRYQICDCDNLESDEDFAGMFEQ